MATKEQNLKRLDELALILGREPDISGSAAEIAQRVAEWEEEMQSSGDDVQVMNMDIRERETAAHDVREKNIRRVNAHQSSDLPPSLWR